MLGGNILVLHGLGKFLRPAQHPHHIHAHGEAVRALHSGNLAEHLLQLGLQQRQIRLAVLKDSGQKPLRLLGQCQQHMGRSDFLMIFHGSQLLCRLQGRQSAGREFFLSHIYASNLDCKSDFNSLCTH